MVPIYRAGEAPESARVCIDQFEFPNLPCRYPITWVRPIDAAALCASMGKRLCDAHEWEGACAGSLEPPDFRPAGAANAGRDIVWAYGRQRRGDICAFGVPKSPQCDAAMQGRANALAVCGANTYPSGYFTQCRSAFGVYDQHGNVAEHMVLPRSPGELRSNAQSGVTEMKGSWFGFSRAANSSVHPDDCRWREPGWHRTAAGAGNGHANYHLGFRCCKTLAAPTGR
jgi:formylglycine-generating enzyme required for sulfatase activity